MSPARRPRAALALLVVAGLGCATIMRGTTSLVTVRSDAPGALVFVDGAPCGVTPLVVPLDHTVAHDVVVRRDGMQQAFRLTSGVEAAWVVLDLFATGAVGIVVDAITGAWSALSQTDVFASFGAASLLAPTLPPPSSAPVPVAPWTAPP